MAAAGTLENPGALRVGSFDNQGGTIVGNLPVVQGIAPGGVVRIREIRPVDFSANQVRPHAPQDLVVIWEAPTRFGFALEFSGDLEHWETVVTPPVVAEEQPFQTRVPASLGNQFFRIVWQGMDGVGEE